MQFSVNQCIFCGSFNSSLDSSTTTASSQSETSPTSASSTALIPQTRAKPTLSKDTLVTIFSFVGIVADCAAVNRDWSAAASHSKFKEMRRWEYVVLIKIHDLFLKENPDDKTLWNLQRTW